LTKLRPTTRVARGATYLFIQGFASSVVSLVYFVVLVGILSENEMGVYTLLTFTLNLVPILGTFALPSAAAKYIPQYLAKGNLEKAKSIVDRLLSIWLFSSAIFFSLLFLPAEFLSKLMFGSAVYALLFRLLALCAVFTILNIFMLNCLRGLQRMGEFALISFVYAFLQSVLGIYLLSTLPAGQKLLGVVLSWLTGILVSSTTGLVLTLKYLGLGRKLHPLKPLIKFSYPLYISNIVVFIAAWADSLIIFSYMNTVFGSIEAQEMLGTYYVAVRASLVPMLFSTSIIIALFPQLSELYTQQGLNSLKDAFRLSTRYLALIGFPMIIGLAALSNPVLEVFAGKYAERGAAILLTIICFAALPATLGVAINPILMTLERTKTVSIITVVSILFNIGASYVALAYVNLGLRGPALARAFSSIMTFGLGVYALKRFFSPSFDTEALWKTAVSSFLMVAPILFLERIRQILMPSFSQLSHVTFYLLILYVVIGAGVYLLSLFSLKAVKKSDIELLHDYLPKGFKWIATWLSRIAV
jgi:O-antigen/teichoic acid export membrane protein